MNIIRIGNSRGIRIPRALLQQCALEGEVDIEAREEGLLVRRLRAPRQGWAEAFQEMSAKGDDALLDPESATPTRWEQDEWRW